MRASDLMITDFDLIPDDTPLLDAVSRMRARTLAAGHVDVRCLVVMDKAGNPTHVLTEADLIRATLPWFFREKKFSDFVGKWLSSGLPQAALEELFEDLARGARKKLVRDVIGERTLVTVDEDASLIKIAYMLYVERIKTLPVVRDGKIVGIVYRTAVFEAIAKALGGDKS